MDSTYMVGIIVAVEKIKHNSIYEQNEQILASK